MYQFTLKNGNVRKFVDYLIMDIDGVLTNAKKIFNEKHEIIYKEFNDKDFTAIKLFQKEGVHCAFLTGDVTNASMAHKRNVDIYYSRYMKFTRLKKEIPNIDLKRTIYIGDDWNDVPLLQSVGYPFCPADAPDYVEYNGNINKLNTVGGAGCIAEIAFYFMEVRE